jgi:hypothetical protein
VLSMIVAVTTAPDASAQIGAGITVTPTQIQFPPIELGAFGLQTFVILDTKLDGRATGTVGEPADSSYQIISGGGSFDLGFGESRLVVVRFDPTKAGSAEDSIAITLNGGSGGDSSTVYVHLLGSGTAGGNGGGTQGNVKLDVSTDLLDFGGVKLGALGQHQVTITNSSDSARLNGVIALDADPGFSIASGGGAFNLAPGESRVVTVGLTPSVVGALDGSLKIDYSSPDTTGTKVVALTGTGLSVDIGGGGGGGTGGGGTGVSDSVSASVLTQGIYFGNVQVGQSSQRDVMITNTSDTAHLMVAIGGGTSLNAPFSATIGGSGLLTIAPGETRSVMVSFTPTATGYFSDTLQLVTNVTGSTGPINVVVQGSGINSTGGGNGGGNGGGSGGEAIALSSDKIDFGAMTVGQTAQRSFTVTNPAAAGSLTVNVSNPAAPFFLSTSAGPMTLSPGESRTIVLNYTPSFAGTFNDNLALAYSNGSSSGTIYMPLSGSASAVVLGVDDEATPAASMMAPRSYPNPFTSSATIGFTLAGSGPVSLAVYNMRGDEVAVLADGTYEAGDHSIVWDARGMASGLYLLRLRAGGASVTSYLTLMK